MNKLNNKEIKIVGVAGNEGSFSEEAANYFCKKNNIVDYKLKYLLTVKNSLQNLNTDEIDLAIFPIENSNGGIVFESVYAMSSYNFEIKSIFEIDIKMNLLIRKDTNPGNIKKIVSHPQALKQCRMYLKRKWFGIELEEYSDTASAARDLSIGKIDKNCAVISSAICTKLYGLDFLEEGIQDLKFNFTSFIAATKKIAT